MICTTPHCGGLVTWVPPGEREKAHYRCQGPCGKPYKASAMVMERIETREPEKRKEVKKMTEEVTPIKTCNGCGKVKPATTEYFYKAKGGKYGLNGTCRECRSAWFKEKWARDNTGKKRRRGPVLIPDPAPTKIDQGPQPDPVTPETIFRSLERQFVDMACKSIREAFGL